MFLRSVGGIVELMITPEEIKKLFELAKIEATPEELEKFPREIDAILAYVKKLSDAPVDNISPTLSMVPDALLRQDEARQPGKDFIKSFPASRKGYLETKKVFGSE